MKLMNDNNKSNIKGEEIALAARTDFKVSISHYAKKERKNIPQKVASLLAATMLVSMFASCDEILESTQPGEETTAVESEEQTTIPEDEINIPKYQTLEVEEVGEVTIDGEEVSVDNIGLGLLRVFDYKNIMTSGSCSSVVSSKYNEIKKDPKNYNWDKDAFKIMTINKVSNPNEKRDIFSWNFEDQNAGWKHKIVSTNYNFALESTDPKGRVYLTGFVNGRLENDLGLIDENTINAMKAMAQAHSYNDIVNAVRQEFFSVVYVLQNEDKNNRFHLDYSITTEGGVDHGEVDPFDRIYKLSKLTIKNERASRFIELKPDYEISENYFDELLESGVVVGNGNEKTWDGTDVP